MSNTNFIFFQFFQDLRQTVGMQLDMEQFHTFLILFAAGRWQPDLENMPENEQPLQVKKALYQLCATLWLNRSKHQKAFQKAFERAYDNLQELLPETVEQPVDNELIKSPLKEKETAEKTKNFDSIAEQEIDNSLVNQPEIEEDKTDVEPRPAEGQKSVFLNFKESQKKPFMSASSAKMEQRSALETEFIFSDEKHLPIPTRKLTQLWKKLQNSYQKQEGKQIDLKTTVNKLVKEFVIDRPVYEMERKGNQRFIVLLEGSSEMIAFQPWINQLVTTLQNSHKNRLVSTYYFHHFPTPVRAKSTVDKAENFWLYESPLQLSSRRLSEIMRAETKQTKYLIFSDAGALSATTDSHRIQQLWQFLEQLEKHGSRPLWFNPLPREQWADSTALYVAMKTKMLPYNLEGIEQGIKFLRE